MSIIKRLTEQPTPKKYVDLLISGCSACDFDEAEGDLISHCSDCQLVITKWSYTLFVWEQRKIGVIPVRLREKEAS